MASFDGINAYANFVAGTYLTVSEGQPVTSWERRVGATGAKRVVEDEITLSGTAQAFLDHRARTGNPAFTDREGAPALVPGSVDPANLVGVDLSGKDFSGTDLTRAFLYRTNLVGVDFSKATLKDAWIAESDVRGAIFDGADLRGANLSKARNLTREQLATALVDLRTVLPFAVTLER
jgi:uncharacterized protein YjbI with pentapeptide repeats